MGNTARVAKQPSVYDYEDYRKYLGDMYGYHKYNTPGFSFRTFATEAGFKSPNFLKLLIDGKRKMSLDSVRKIIKVFQLSPDEGTFFRNLVFMNQSTTTKERAGHLELLYRSKIFRELHPLKPAQFDYYNKWYHIPIREMVASPQFQEDSKWIAARLHDKVNENEVREAIENLLSLGLLVRAADGKLHQAQSNVTTGHEVASSAVAEFHRQMMRLAGNSIDSVPRTKREISSSTLLISEEALGRLKDLIQEFRRTLLSEAARGDQNKPTVVYNLSLLLFPLTETLASEDSEDPCKKAS
jgi:uncharacterized protein (TIGR02147 family)